MADARGIRSSAETIAPLVAEPGPRRRLTR